MTENEPRDEKDIADKYNLTDRSAAFADSLDKSPDTITAQEVATGEVIAMVDREPRVKYANLIDSAEIYGMDGTIEVLTDYDWGGNDSRAIRFKE